MGPHQALGYWTPNQFYHYWLNINATGKEVLSNISCAVKALLSTIAFCYAVVRQARRYRLTSFEQQ